MTFGLGCFGTNI